jgi:ribosomal protein S18 acetylase RimI-like enzyme
MPVRPATTTDIAALVRVINRAYLVEAHIFHGDRTNEAEVRERVEQPNACFLVIDDAESPRSMIAAAVYVELRGDRGYFGLLSVDPDRQKRGLARTLIAAAEAHASAAGCEVMDIDVVDQRIDLRGFYERFGYEPIAKTPYAKPGVTKVPVSMIRMAKTLPRGNGRASFR